jgi:hypothetical protein
MSTSEKFALAARMHVMLRRKTGRVTDTEWMACNVQYAAEIVRFSREYATTEGHPDLAELADRLEHTMLPARPAPPAYKKPDLVPISHGLIRYVRGLR